MYFSRYFDFINQRNTKVNDKINFKKIVDSDHFHNNGHTCRNINYVDNNNQILILSLRYLCNVTSHYDMRRVEP